MKRLHISRPSPAMVVAVLALIVALAGSAYAATKIGTKQLKNSAVTTKKISNGAVTSDKLANGAVTSGKIENGTLNSLTIARGTTSSCDPASSVFVDCGTATLNLPRSGRVLVMASLGYDGSNSNAYRGDCRLAADGTTAGTTIAFGQATYVPATAGGPGFNANGQEGGSLSFVTGALAAGTHSFSLQCNQAGGSIEFSETAVSAVMLGAG